MSMFFTSKKKDETEELEIVVEEVEESNDVLSKLYANNTIATKLDFNVEFLNKYLVKTINSFLEGRYNQDIKLCEKYLSDNCKKKFLSDINKTLEYSKFLNPIINIKSIDIVSQNIQSVNYISDMVININIEVIYHNKNIFTECVIEVVEKFTQKLWFLYSEKGWILEDYYAREFSYFNDDKIISI